MFRRLLRCKKRLVSVPYLPVHLSVRDLVWATKWFIGFSWSSVSRSSTKMCRENIIFINTSSMAAMLFLKAYMNFEPHFPYLLPDFGKVRYKLSTSNAITFFFKKRSLSGAFSALQPKTDCTLTPKWVPSFISRKATHHTGARDLC